MNPLPSRYALFVCLLFLAGCGYHFQETGGPAAARIGSLSIPLVKSTSTDLGFEGEFTRILRDEFVFHGGIALASREDADTVLLGEVSEIRTAPLSYSILRTPVEGHTANYPVTNSRRLLIRFGAKLVERTSGKIIWEARDMEEVSSYRVGTDPLQNRYNRRRALAVVAERFAKRVYLKTVAGF